MRLMTYDQMKSKGVPYSGMHLRRLEAAGKFPRRVKIGARVAWVETEVDEWLAAKVEARDKVAA